MTPEEIIDCIHTVLKERPFDCRLASFHPGARFREDLGLDSLGFLNLVLYLEVDYGLALPEDVALKDVARDVRGLALAFGVFQEPTPILEEPAGLQEIKVHCFVSCVCEIVKKSPLVDHRPFYFGVWDAEIFTDERYAITYHADHVDHAFFCDWFRKLYGVELRSWYERDLSKETNLQTLCARVEGRRAHEHVMVMLDLHQLPERENKFSANPFPHYVLLEATEDPESWLMLDHDFRWQGRLPKARILDAVRQPCVAGGYVFDERQLRPTPAGAVHGYFTACLQADRNPLTDAIRRAVAGHLSGRDRDGRPLALANLAEAVKHIPVLAIRKYAYEHGFGFFWRALALDPQEFDRWCEAIQELAERYKDIHYRALKLAATGEPGLPAEIHRLLDQQDEREFLLKRRLIAVHDQWLKSLCHAALPMPEVATP